MYSILLVSICFCVCLCLLSVSLLVHTLFFSAVRARSFVVCPGSPGAPSLVPRLGRGSPRLAPGALGVLADSVGLCLRQGVGGDHGREGGGCQVEIFSRTAQVSLPNSRFLGLLA